MTTHATSAQAILRARIARLERLLAELEQHDREIRKLRFELVKFKQGVSDNDPRPSPAVRRLLRR
jgi:hypothetical protein